MKHGKNPSLKEKILIKRLGRNPANWLVVKHTPILLDIVHRHTGHLEPYIKEEDGKWRRKESA